MRGRGGIRHTVTICNDASNTRRGAFQLKQCKDLKEILRTRDEKRKIGMGDES